MGYRLAKDLSALPPKADKQRAPPNGRFVPKADTTRRSKLAPVSVFG